MINTRTKDGEDGGDADARRRAAVKAGRDGVVSDPERDKVACVGNRRVGAIERDGAAPPFRATVPCDRERVIGGGRRDTHGEPDLGRRVAVDWAGDDGEGGKGQAGSYHVEGSR